MMVSHKLGIPEETILGWKVEKFERWLAYIELTTPKQKKGSRRR